MTYRHDPGQDPGPGTDLKNGFSTTVALMMAMIFAPIVNEYSVPILRWAARFSYGPDIIEFIELAWFFLCFPLVFFAARAGIAYALTAAGVYLAYRLI